MIVESEEMDLPVYNVFVCASTHLVEPTCSSSHACVCVRVCALICLLACVQREVIILSLFRG